MSVGNTPCNLHRSNHLDQTTKETTSSACQTMEWENERLPSKLCVWRRQVIVLKDALEIIGAKGRIPRGEWGVIRTCEDFRALGSSSVQVGDLAPCAKGATLPSSLARKIKQVHIHCTSPQHTQTIRFLSVCLPTIFKQPKCSKPPA
uniref:Uncharacterized protein n=1 Tax=Sphaerodactylus townsendi TaxID=933632 RepID=A0ACB8EZ86_9SAUR